MATFDAPDAPGVLAYRLRKVEEEAATVRREKANAQDMARLEAQVALKADTVDVIQISNEVAGLRKALLGFLAGIAGSTVLASITVFYAASQHAFG